MIWKLDPQRQADVYTQAGEQNGLPPQAIEKDWWVTQCLKAIFTSDEGLHLIFKGGTSLSKGWGLIERFSEDIDLAISRERLGFKGELSRQQIKKLRKASCSFVSSDLKNILATQLRAMGIPAANFEVEVEESPISDTDPQSIYVRYDPVVGEALYLRARVKIEVGSRSLMEPVEFRSISSIVDATFPEASFSADAIQIPSVLPQRTFLEKVCLLHELLQKSPDSVGDRMARHYYDLWRIMDTEHGLQAVRDDDLLRTIVAHRQVYTSISGVDYEGMNRQVLSIIPPAEHRTVWQNDYRQLQQNMIYGDAPSFDQLMSAMKGLEERFRHQG